MQTSGRSVPLGQRFGRGGFGQLLNPPGDPLDSGLQPAGGACHTLPLGLGLLQRVQPGLALGLELAQGGGLDMQVGQLVLHRVDFRFNWNEGVLSRPHLGLALGGDVVEGLDAGQHSDRLFQHLGSDHIPLGQVEGINKTLVGEAAQLDNHLVDRLQTAGQGYGRSGLGELGGTCAIAVKLAADRIGVAVPDPEIDPQGARKLPPLDDLGQLAGLNRRGPAEKRQADDLDD